MRMAERLGAEEKRALRFIARREERGDPSPGNREIGCVVGLEEAREVQRLLSSLVEGGYLVQDEGWRRMLQLTSRGWRLVEDLDGAGRERGLAEGYEDYVPLHSADGVRRHLLRVEAGSLIRAGMSGEGLVVVEEGPEPRDGELVAALVGGEMLVKRLRREEGLVSLLPADGTPADPGDGPVYEPPLPASAAEIKGRVVYVVCPLEAQGNFRQV